MTPPAPKFRVGQIVYGGAYGPHRVLEVLGWDERTGTCWYIVENLEDIYDWFHTPAGTRGKADERFFKEGR